MKLTWKETCKEVVEVLHDYLDGSLDRKLKESLDRHFARCGDCRAFLQTYGEVIRLSGELPAAEIPPAVRQRVRAALRERFAR